MKKCFKPWQETVTAWAVSQRCCCSLFLTLANYWRPVDVGDRIHDEDIESCFQVVLVSCWCFRLWLRVLFSINSRPHVRIIFNSCWTQFLFFLGQLVSIIVLLICYTKRTYFVSSDYSPTATFFSSRHFSLHPLELCTALIISPLLSYYFLFLCLCVVWPNVDSLCLMWSYLYQPGRILFWRVSPRVCLVCLNTFRW